MMKNFGKMFQVLLVLALVTITVALFGCGGGGGSGSGKKGAANTAPTADDGALTTDENQAAAGALSASDADGDALTYSIVANGGIGTATITNPNTGSYTYTPNPNVNGIDTFTFKVNDGTEDSNTATVTVTINPAPPVNNPPTADAGPDQTVSEQTPVVLDGSGSDDIEDGAAGLSYAWTQPGGPPVQLINADTDTPSFTAPAVSASTDLTFQLMVTDTGALTDTDQVTVTVDNDGSLSGSVGTPADRIDLTVEGGLDWSHWGLNAPPNDLDQKVGGTGEIGDYDVIGTVSAVQSSSSPVTFSWSDGNGTPPDDVVADTTTRLIFTTSSVDVDEGIRLTVPAGTSEKTLKVYVGAFSAKGKLTASLSDGSASNYEVFLDNPLDEIQKVWVVTLNFGAAADGETLTVEYTLAEDTGDPTGHINLAAATLD
jgi:hypothetical protein